MSEFMLLDAKAPATLGALSMINGVGTVKLDRYGADVLALVRWQEPSGEIEPSVEHDSITTGDAPGK